MIVGRGGQGKSKNKIGTRGANKVVYVPVGTELHLVEVIFLLWSKFNLQLMLILGRFQVHLMMIFLTLMMVLDELAR